MEKQIVIKTAVLEEWEANAMKWAKELQWNPGCFDAKVFLAADPNGFFLALDKATGEFVGCVCGVRYGLDKGFIGIYIVRKEFRGRGIGMALFSKAMQHLEGRIVALDAVEEQIPNYQKWNLKVTRWNSRYKTIFNFDRIRGCEDANSGLLTHDLPTSVTDLVEIAAFDRACIGMDRSTPGFFKAFFSQPDLKCVRSADGWGILVIRRAADGYRAGPFYAKTPRIARSLMHALLEKYSEELNGQNLYFDMNDANKDALELASHFKLEKIVGFAKMWQPGGDEGENHNQLYSQLSLELG